jgi:2-methylcitrate dehydratase PrpD
MTENTKKLAAFIAGLDFSDLPSDIIHENKRVLLDSLGCAIAGDSMQASKIVSQIAVRLGGKDEATILGRNSKVACTNAAFANAQLINAQDFDAGSVGHDTPAIIAGALAAAETNNASGKDLVLAIALGHELATRLKAAEAAPPSPDGIGTGKTGNLEGLGYAFVTLAVAASSGKLFTLNPEQIRRALGIASFIHPPNTNKRYFDISPVWNVKYTVFGQVAETGVISALLAQMGFTGDDEILDRESCFWKAAGQKAWTPDKIVQNIGEKWTHTISYKRYPSNYPTAGAKDCLSEIIEENDVQPEEIEKITARIWPIWQYRSMRENRLRTEEDFIFNVPYQLTCAAFRINPTRWLDPEVRKDPELSGFMKRVKFDIDCDEKEYNQAKESNPKANLCSAEIVARGTTFKKQTLYRKGLNSPPECRMTDNELVDKFKGNVSKILSGGAAMKVAGAIFEIDKFGRASDVIGMLSPVST